MLLITNEVDPFIFHCVYLYKIQIYYSICFFQYLDLYKELGLRLEDLTNYDTPLVGFNRKVVVPNGQIKLLIMTEGKEVMVNFIVVNNFSRYTMILGRSWIHAIGAVPSTLHQKAKFTTRLHACSKALIIFFRKKLIICIHYNFRLLHFPITKKPKGMMSDRMARNQFISDSSIGIVHVQKSRLDQEPPKEIEKCCLNEKIIYN